MKSCSQEWGMIFLLRIVSYQGSTFPWYIHGIFGRFCSRLVVQEVLISRCFAIPLSLHSRNLENYSEHVIAHKEWAVITQTLQTHSDGLILQGLSPETFEQLRQWGPSHLLQPLWLEEFPHPSWAAPAATRGCVPLLMEKVKELHSCGPSNWKCFCLCSRLWPASLFLAS